MLSVEEERVIVEHLKVKCDFEFPITGYALRCVVKVYLENLGRPVKCDNLPGYDWGRYFLWHHPELSTRMSSNEIGLRYLRRL